MSLIKIQIKSIFGTVLFEYEKENNTIKDTICEASLREASLRGANLRGADLREANLREANLRGASLRGADLRGADLCGADLRGANLYAADLRGANLCGANLYAANLCEADLREADLREADLRGADLRGAEGIENTEWFNQCSQNILFILSYLIPEVQGLKEKLIDGKVNGSQYEGECCCLVGTLGKNKGGSDEVCSIIPFYTKGTHNLGEQFFLNIREGDTPETNIFSKRAVELCDMILDKKV